ncbi:hypothetical protein AA103196_1561 [Ameyamaea chiangmaiensis NBRC 103196]|nr:hypothetical protein AA103196_1561 [Ameyamaea chiangmaiensis NBRC 103196]
MGANFDPHAVPVPSTIAPDFKTIAEDILAHKDKMATRGDWNQRVVDYCDYASQAFSIVSFASFFGKTPADLQTAFGLVSSGLSVFTAFEEACVRINRYTRGNWSRATLHGDTKIYIANPYLRVSLEPASHEVPYNTIAYFKRRGRKQTARSLAALCSLFLRCKTVVDVSALTTALSSLVSSSVKFHKLKAIDATGPTEDHRKLHDALRTATTSKLKKIVNKTAAVFSAASPHGAGVVYHQGVNIGDIATKVGQGIQIAATGITQLDKLSTDWRKSFKEAFDPRTIALGTPKDVNTQIYIAAAYIHFRAVLEQSAVNVRPDVRTSHIPQQSEREARYLAQKSGIGNAFTRHLARTAYSQQHKQQVARAGKTYSTDETQRMNAGPATAIFKVVFSSTFGERGHQYDYLALINEPAGWLALADKLSI